MKNKEKYYRQLPKLKVAGSNPVARSNISSVYVSFSHKRFFCITARITSKIKNNKKVWRRRGQKKSLLKGSKVAAFFMPLPRNITSLCSGMMTGICLVLCSHFTVY